MNGMETNWQDVIQAADELIELYKQCMNNYPEHGPFYQEQMALTMWKRLLALEALKKEQDENS